MIFGYLSTLFLNSNIWMFAIALSPIAIGLALITPSLQALISTQIAPDQQGSGMGFLSSFSALARILGPLAFGIAFDVSGFLLISVISISFLCSIFISLQIFNLKTKTSKSNEL